MMMDKSIILTLVSTFLCVASIDRHPSIIKRVSKDGDKTVIRLKFKFTDNVKVDFFYESLCPGSIEEYPNLIPVATKLSDYVDIKTYPYGNAKMGKKNGTIEVKCQHGEEECYGNKLHACAIDQLKDVQKYVDFNACMMAKRSNDDAADACGKSKNVDSGPIKTCAKGARGQKLLIQYGRETGKYNINYVPYILINGKELVDNDLWTAVCAAIVNPPKVCQKRDKNNL
ncbi:uncharacterized protein LOC126376071 isoform X4 [Pectinophora gossypiella]|uniref:uncharacterized protein LOC126376071 isoform X4 n=1 Tax=Pectinophora gossypiella TaxID=13191 RepID=UPI00214F18E1|nr:uncharacterized protein LOC126376071 isoform X4 [Pectinophora gossypiella]